MDRILIGDLRFRCIIGINPDERREKQDVIINVAMHTDLRTPGATDAIDDTVDYKSIKLRIREMVEASSYNLVEKLAAEIARICLEPRAVERVVVRVDKPGALRFARTVAVEVDRTRADFEE